MPNKIPAREIALSLSPFGGLGRTVFLFPCRSGSAVLELPPDDLSATILRALADDAQSRSFALYRSPNYSTRLRNLRTDSCAAPVAVSNPLHDLKTAKASAGDANCYLLRGADGTLVTRGLECHPTHNAYAPLTLGRGPVCSLNSGSSKGCAFISRLSAWDGLHYNDPLAGSVLKARPFGFDGSSGNLLIALAEYTLCHIDELRSQRTDVIRLLPKSETWWPTLSEAVVNRIRDNLRKAALYISGV